MPTSTQGKQTEHFFGCSCHLLAPVRLAAVVVASAVRLAAVCVVVVRVDVVAVRLAVVRVVAVRVDVAVCGAGVVAIVGSGRLPSTIVFDKKDRNRTYSGRQVCGKRHHDGRDGVEPNQT